MTQECCFSITVATLSPPLWCEQQDIFSSRGGTCDTPKAQQTGSFYNCHLSLLHSGTKYEDTCIKSYPQLLLIQNNSYIFVFSSHHHWIARNNHLPIIKQIIQKLHCYSKSQAWANETKANFPAFYEPRNKVSEDSERAETQFLSSHDCSPEI